MGSAAIRLFGGRACGTLVHIEHFALVLKATKTGERLAQSGLDRPRRIAQLAPGFLDRQFRRSQCDPHAFGGPGRRPPRHMVREEFEHGRRDFGDPGGNRDEDRPAAADRAHEPKYVFHPDALAAEDVALPDPSALHREDEAGCHIAHIDKVHDEIEVQMKPAVEKMPQHRGRRGQIVVMRTDRHGRRTDHDGESGSRRLDRPMLSERFRARIGARHGIGGRQDVFRGRFAGSLGMEQDGFGRAMQESGDATLPRGGKHDFGATTIDLVKIISVRHPHAGEAGEVVDFLDVDERLVHDAPIEHRTVDILNIRWRARRAAKVENPHTATSREERRYQVLSDKAAASGDKNGCHEAETVDGVGAMIAARSCRNPSAMNNFAITNIGPSNRWLGLSTSDGCRRSKTRWPTICAPTPRTVKMAKIDHIVIVLTEPTIMAPTESSTIAAARIAIPRAVSSRSQ